MLRLLDDIFPVPRAPPFQRGRDAGHLGGVPGEGECCGAGILVVEAELLGRQRLRFGDAGYLGRHLQLLIVLGVRLVVFGVGGALDDLARGGVGVADAAGRVLGVRRADRQVILGVAPAAPLHGEGRVLGLIVSLVEQHQDVVRGLEGDPGVVAKLGQEFDVAHLVLLHPLIIGVAGGFIEAGHAVGTGHFLGDAGEGIGLPRLGLFGLPDLRVEGQRRGLDGDGGWRPGRLDAVELELPAVQNGVLAVVVPVFPDEDRLDGEAGGGGGLGTLFRLAPADLLDVLGADIGRLSAVLDSGPAVGDPRYGNLRAIGQRPELPVARSRACADVQADRGRHLVGLCFRLSCALCGGGGGRCLDGVVQPLLQPNTVPVLELDLQVVRLVLLVVGVGQRQQVGADG